MSTGNYQRFSITIRNTSGALIQHDFLVQANAARDSAALAILPRLAQVLNVPEPTDQDQIAAAVRRIKNGLVAYDAVSRIRATPSWIRLSACGACAVLLAATTHFCGFEPEVTS